MKTQSRHSKPTYRKRGMHSKSHIRKTKRGTRFRALLVGASCVLAAAAGLLSLPVNTIAESPEARQKSTLANLMSQAQLEQLAAKYEERLSSDDDADAFSYAEAMDSSTLKPIAKPKIKSVSQSEDGVLVQWGKVKAAQGYDVYRSADGKTWEQLDHIESSPTYYHDIDTDAGVSYSYAVVSTTDADGYRNSASSNHAERMFLAAPKVKVAQGTSSAKITWKKVRGATGYVVQYAKNRFFVGAKSIEVNGASSLSAPAKGLGKGAECYARVQAVRKGEGNSVQDGCWAYSSNATSDSTARLSALKVKKKVKSGKKTKTKKIALELRGAAKQKVAGYDTLQGSCYGGSYMYYALYNRDLNKGKIVKLSLDKMKVAKVSKALDIFHANDMTYNSKIDRVIVVHGEGDGRGLSIVNPATLKVEKRVAVSRNVSNIFDAEDAGIDRISGISAIAYNAKRDCYIATVSGSHELLILDANFKPINLLALSSKSFGVYQNIETGNDVVAVSTSAGVLQGGNYLWLYSWTGKQLGKVFLPKDMELESIFFKGDKLYASFYLSGQKMKAKTVVTTKRARNSAGKIVKRKVKQKVKYMAVTRDNYCYKVSGI